MPHMPHNIHIAIPPEVGPHTFSEEIPISQPLMQTLSISLLDPRPILDVLYNLQSRYYEDNIKIAGIELGYQQYYTLKAYIESRGLYPSFGSYVDGIEFDGMMISMDPHRVGGAPKLLFSESDALKVLGRLQRRRC